MGSSRWIHLLIPCSTVSRLYQHVYGWTSRGKPLSSVPLHDEPILRTCSLVSSDLRPFQFPPNRMTCQTECLLVVDCSRLETPAAVFHCSVISITLSIELHRPFQPGGASILPIPWNARARPAMPFIILGQTASSLLLPLSGMVPGRRIQLNSPFNPPLLAIIGTLTIVRSLPIDYAHD